MNPISPKILYVEDNPVNRHLVRRILTKAGYVVLEAKDGLTGIRIAEQKRPDLILMDLMLPGMDGYQVTTRLKSLPELAHTPIVALTAKTMEGARERALVAGCDGYIPKPIDVEQLPTQIAEFLSGKREEWRGDPEERLTLQREYTQELVLQLEQKIRALEKANIELRYADELKSKFIALASHELKSPLAVIQGYLMMLQDRTDELAPALDEMWHLSLRGISKGLDRLKSIVEDMLDVTRIESQTLQVHSEPTVLKEIILSVIRNLKPDTEERDLSIELDSMHWLPTINVDVRRMQQAFYHLLSNAIKYTPDGGKIRISGKVVQGIELAHHGRPASRSGEFVQVVIADTGVGIDPEEQERIFDLFYEARDINLHSTSKTRFMGGGLGLGLAIVRGIIEAHGGFLWVESEGHNTEKCPGSRFNVLLPIQS